MTEKIEDKFDKLIKTAKEALGEYFELSHYILPVHILENDVSAVKEYKDNDESGGCGEELVLLNEKHLEALKNGKILVVSPQHEYEVYIIIGDIDGKSMAKKNGKKAG